jgi:hypothetical protein
MNADADDFRRHYAVLSDEALLDLKPDDLTDVARQCYEVELFNRGLKRAAPPKLEESQPEESPLVFPQPKYLMEHIPWKSTAVSVVEFEHAEDAEQARDVLEQAAIPCALVGKQQDASLGSRRKYRGKWIALMVPRSFLENAQQRLRTEIDEPSAEEDYAKHFVDFSEDELLDVDIQTLPESGRKWYLAELKQRGLKQKARATIPNPPPEAVPDGFDSVATLPEKEAGAAKQFLERESIPCRVERDAPEGGFESFAILVPASYVDQASEILNRHEAEILSHEPAEGQAAADDPFRLN